MKSSGGLAKNIVNLGANARRLKRIAPFFGAGLTLLALWEKREQMNDFVQATLKGGKRWDLAKQMDVAEELVELMGIEATLGGKTFLELAGSSLWASDERAALYEFAQLLNGWRRSLR